MPPETTAMATPMRMRLVMSTLSFSSAPPRARSAADGAVVVGARLLGDAEGTAVGAVLPGAAVGAVLPGAAVGSAVGERVWQSAPADRACRKAMPAAWPAPPKGRKAMPAAIPAEPAVKPTPWALPRRVSRRCVGLGK